MKLLAAVAAVTLMLTPFSADRALADNDPENDPEYCGGCHTRIFEEWQSSAMGSDMHNSHVLQLYLGHDGNNKPDGLGYQGVFPGKKGDSDLCGMERAL